MLVLFWMEPLENKFSYFPMILFIQFIPTSNYHFTSLALGIVSCYHLGPTLPNAFIHSHFRGNQRWLQLFYEWEAWSTSDTDHFATASPPRVNNIFLAVLVPYGHWYMVWCRLTIVDLFPGILSQVLSYILRQTGLNLK